MLTPGVDKTKISSKTNFSLLAFMVVLVFLLKNNSKIKSRKFRIDRQNQWWLFVPKQKVKKQNYIISMKPHIYQ